LLKVEEAAQELGLGRTKTYELIACVALEAVHVGKSVRVLVDALDRFVESLREGEGAR
jgi:excisionase family DNA binding protein